MQYFHAVSTIRAMLGWRWERLLRLRRPQPTGGRLNKQITVYDPVVFVADEYGVQTGTSRLLGNRNARRLSQTKEILEFNVSGLDAWRSCSDIDRLPRRNALGLSPRLSVAGPAIRA